MTARVAYINEYSKVRLLPANLVLDESKFPSFSADLGKTKISRNLNGCKYIILDVKSKLYFVVNFEIYDMCQPNLVKTFLD